MENFISQTQPISKGYCARTAWWDDCLSPPFDGVCGGCFAVTVTSIFHSSCTISCHVCTISLTVCATSLQRPTSTGAVGCWAPPWRRHVCTISLTVCVTSLQRPTSTGAVGCWAPTWRQQMLWLTALKTAGICHALHETHFYIYIFFRKKITKPNTVEEKHVSFEINFNWYILTIILLIKTLSFSISFATVSTSDILTIFSPKYLRLCDFVLTKVPQIVWLFFWRNNLISCDCIFSIERILKKNSVYISCTLQFFVSHKNQLIANRLACIVYTI